MLLDQIATLLTQLIAFYIPIDDMSIKITCSVAITAIIYTILKFVWGKTEKFLKKRINYTDNYVIIGNGSKLYNDFIKYMYDKYLNETKGCKIEDSDGMFKMLIEELTHGELYDDYKDNKISITFENNENNENNDDERNAEKKNLSQKNIVIKTKNNMKVLDDYIKSIIREINTNNNQDINMYKLKASGSKKKERTIEWKKNKFLTNKTMHNTIVTNEVQKLYYDDITKFISNKEYYHKKGIPYKRGYLLHGEPGCGKTSLIKAVAHDLNLPLFMIDLSVLNDNSELMTAINELTYHINSNDPYLLIFEDLDRSSLFGKVNQYGDEDKAKSKITQDCILNILDGIDEGQGRIVIITTNELAKIKKFKSLIRPGRIDVVIGVTYCAMDQLKRIIKFYFDNEEIDLHQLKNNIVITPAQLLQILYLVNDINKTIILLNKFIDFIQIDIEKEIFNIKFDELKLEQGENDDDLDDDGCKIINKSGRRSSGSSKSYSKKRKVHYSRSNRRDRNNKRAIDSITRTIDKSKKAIQQFEETVNSSNEMKKLELEGKKLRLKMDELRKEKLICANITPTKCTRKSKSKNDIESDINTDIDIDIVITEPDIIQTDTENIGTLSEMIITEHDNITDIENIATLSDIIITEHDNIAEFDNISEHDNITDTENIVTLSDIIIEQDNIESDNITDSDTIAQYDNRLNVNN